MKYSSILVVKSVCWAIAAFAGLFVASFKLRDRWQTEDDRHLTRTYYRKIWQKIQQTGLLLLPEKVIVSFLNTKDALAVKLVDLSHSLPASVCAFILMVVPLIGAVVGLIVSEWILALALSTPTLTTFLFYLLKKTGIITSGGNIGRTFIMAIVIISSWIASGAIILKFVLDLNIALATLVMVTISPVYTLLIGFPLSVFNFRQRDWKFSESNVIITGITLTASFSITLIALLVGHVADSTYWVPKTMQMLVSNVFFDGLTMLATILILTLAVPPQRRISIPLAVCLDVVVAAIFACASLYCGVAFTERHLGFVEVGRILVALSPDGGHFEIGPYFWAMHTTFIPTLLYMAVIIFCWIGKMLIIPVASVLSRGAIDDKPHNLTASVFAFIAVVFGVIGGCIDKTIDSTPTPQDKKTVSQQTFETNEKTKDIEKRLGNP